MENIDFAVLISGRGSNMEAIFAHCRKREQESVSQTGKRWRLKPKIVISNRGDADGLKIAKQFGIDCHHIPSGKFRTRLDDQAMENYATVLEENGIQLVLLAGFMCILHPPFLKRFPNRIVNIHPSLLPRYTGLNTHKRALANGENHLGITLHLVDQEIDGGRILLQQSIACKCLSLSSPSSAAVGKTANAKEQYEGRDKVKHRSTAEKQEQSDQSASIKTTTLLTKQAMRQLQMLEHSLYRLLLDRINDGKIVLG